MCVEFQQYPIVTNFHEAAVELEGEVDEAADVAAGEGLALFLDGRGEPSRQALAQCLGSSVD